MKVAQMILKGLGVTLEGLANGIAWAGCGLQDVAEDMPTMAYRARMALTRSRKALKRTLCKARRVARLAWSGASRGLLEGLTVLANVVVTLWMVGKVIGHTLRASGKALSGVLRVTVDMVSYTLTVVGTWAGRTVVNVGAWAKDAWAFRSEVIAEGA